MSSAPPIGTPIQPSHGAITVVERIEAATRMVHSARQEVAEVLADADAKESMQRREHDLDRLAAWLRRSGRSAAT